MGCMACQVDVLRNAYKAKDTSLGSKGITPRAMILKRTELSWASGNVRSQFDKLAHHEKNGMHRFYNPRWARSKFHPGYDHFTADCIKYGLLTEHEAHVVPKVESPSKEHVNSPISEPARDIDTYIVGENLVDLVKRVTQKNWTLLVSKEASQHIVERWVLSYVFSEIRPVFSASPPHS